RSPGEVSTRSIALFGADLTFPILAVLVTFASGAVLLAKVGSALNHVLELNAAASLLCGVVFASGWNTARMRSLCLAGSLMLVPMIAFDAALLRQDTGRLAVALQLKSWGAGLRLTSPADVADLARLETIVDGLPKPVYVQNELLNQPWHTNGGRYPTV